MIEIRDRAKYDEFVDFYGKNPKARWVPAGEVSEYYEHELDGGDLFQLTFPVKDRFDPASPIYFCKATDHSHKGRGENIAAIQESVVHPNILRMLYLTTMGSFSCAILEYLDPETWTELAKFNGSNSLSFEEIEQVAMQIAETMDHMAACGVRHGDIATRNIYASRSESGMKIKIIDFGCAGFFDLDKASEIYQQIWDGDTPVLWYGESAINLHSDARALSETVLELIGAIDGKSTYHASVEINSRLRQIDWSASSRPSFVEICKTILALGRSEELQTPDQDHE